MEDVILTVRQAARIADRMTQSLYIAMKKNKLRAVKKEGKWYIHRKDLDEYVAFRYCRDKSKDKDGNLIYDHSKGRFSPVQIEKLTGIDLQMIYYWLRTGQLKHSRIGSKYILDIEDVKKLNLQKKLAVK